LTKINKYVIIFNMSEVLLSGLETEQPLPLVQFNISRLVEVAPVVETATQAAVTAVWKRHIDEPTSVNLIFAETIRLGLPNGGSTLVNAEYDKGTDTIVIALGTLQERHPELPLEAAAVLHAGHETRHKVQTLLGDAPSDSNHLMLEGAYTDSRHEVEAWQSAVEAYSDVYPGKWISFAVGQHTYSNHPA
jgi:hypothetical protein